MPGWMSNTETQLCCNPIACSVVRGIVLLRRPGI